MKTSLHAVLSLCVGLCFASTVAAQVAPTDAAPVPVKTDAAAAVSSSPDKSAAPVVKPEQTESASKAPASAKKSAYSKKDTYFILNTYDGGTIDLADYNNKPVLLMFFASYCPYCKRAVPMVQRISAAYASKGLTVLGISTEASPDKARDFVKTHNVSFPVMIDGKLVFQTYKGRGVPTFFLLDGSHSINASFAGYDQDSEQEITSAIDGLLAPNKKS